MKNNQEKSYKIKITYKNENEIWNKISDFLITFIVNTDIKELNTVGEYRNDK